MTGCNQTITRFARRRSPAPFTADYCANDRLEWLRQVLWMRDAVAFRYSVGYLSSLAMALRSYSFEESSSGLREDSQVIPKRSGYC
jgi:hypothetical protein